MIEIRLRFIESALLDFHHGLSLVQSRHRLIEISLGRVLFFHQVLCARGGGPR